MYSHNIYSFLLSSPTISTTTSWDGIISPRGCNNNYYNNLTLTPRPIFDFDDTLSPPSPRTSEQLINKELFPSNQPIVVDTSSSPSLDLYKNEGDETLLLLEEAPSTYLHEQLMEVIESASIPRYISQDSISPYSSTETVFTPSPPPISRSPLKLKLKIPPGAKTSKLLKIESSAAERATIKVSDMVLIGETQNTPLLVSYNEEIIEKEGEEEEKMEEVEEEEDEYSEEDDFDNDDDDDEDYSPTESEEEEEEKYTYIPRKKVPKTPSVLISNLRQPRKASVLSLSHSSRSIQSIHATSTKPIKRSVNESHKKQKSSSKSSSSSATNGKPTRNYRINADKNRRVDKSLKVLCDGLFEYLCLQKVNQVINLDEASEELKVTQRRFYEILNMFECFEIVSKSDRSYIWLGIKSLHSNVNSIIHSKRDHSNNNNNNNNKKKSAKKGNDIDKKQKSLIKLCKNFLSLFSTRTSFTAPQAIELLGIVHQKAKSRRIYDIANILQSLGIITKKRKSSSDKTVLFELTNNYSK